MPDPHTPFIPNEWELAVRSLELIHRATGARIGIADEHIDAILGLEPGTTAAMTRQYNGIVGSAKGVGERVAELLRRTELPGVVDIGASLAEDLVSRGPVERAAELMNAHGVGWTRMERILRALIANVGVEAPTPAAEDAPASGPADVEALWTGPMGRAGGRAGWALAREALAMVHGAGLGALSEARAAQLAGALLGLLDHGTLDHAALLGAVGRLIRQWMEQGEPAPKPEEPKPEEPKPEEPKPEEADEDPFPEGEPLPPEEFPDGTRYDILVISYDVFTETFRLVLLLADAVWDRPGAVPDSGVAAAAAQVNADPAHATKRGVPAAAAGQCRDFVSPPLPNAEVVFAAIMRRYQLDTLFILSFGTMLSNPSEVRQGSQFDSLPGYPDPQRLGFGLEKRVAITTGYSGPLVLRSLNAFLHWSQQGGKSSTKVLSRIDDRSMLIRPTKMYPSQPDFSTPMTRSWSVDQQTSLLFGRRQRAGGARARAEYEHTAEPLAEASTLHGEVNANPTSSATLDGSLGSTRVKDRTFGYRPAGTLDQTTSTPITEVVGHPTSDSANGGAGAAAGSWSALGVTLPSDPHASLGKLTTGPGTPTETGDAKVSIPLTTSTYEEHANGASPGAAAAAGDHKVIWISGSRGRVSAERLVDRDDAADSMAEATFRGTQHEVKHTTVMTVQDGGHHGYLLRLAGSDTPCFPNPEPETVVARTVPPGGHRVYERSQRATGAEVAGTITVHGGSARVWTVEHRIVEETLVIEGQQDCVLATVTVLDPSATDPAKHLKVTYGPDAPRGAVRNVSRVTRTSRSLFLRR